MTTDILHESLRFTMRPEVQVGRNLAALFFDRAMKTPEAPAYLAPQEGGGWRTIPWHEAEERVRAIAGGLVRLGVQPGDRVGLLATTSVDWIEADLATVAAGAVTTSIYASNTADECAYVIADSQSRFCFVENAAQAQKLVAKRAELPRLERIITFDGSASDDGFVVPMSAIEDPGVDVEHIARALSANDLATLIYTSGTTGKPKGVEITHDNLLFTAESIDRCRILGRDDVQLLWLPLAHSFAKILEVVPIQIGFPTAVDGRQDALAANFTSVQPTFVAAVPRVFEKVFAKVVASGHEGGAAKAAIFDWALDVGRRASKLRRGGGVPGPVLRLEERVADRLVFAKLRARFGGRLRFFVSGSAPLATEILELFDAASVLILEGYGLTETMAASVLNLPEQRRIGTVGKPLPGVEVMIAPEDGEILMRGRGVMRGYHGLVDATAESFTDSGWFKTGDIGELDRDGYLRITDRKKDLLKTSGGKYIAPQALEGALKVRCSMVSQVVVHGDKRNYVTALVALDEAALSSWAADNGLEARTYAELASDPRVRAFVQQHVDAMNARLASYEQVKKIAILPADLTLESGDLTPTLKVKRKVVEKKYRAILDALYDDPARP